MTDDELIQLAKDAGLLERLSDVAFDRCMSGDISVIRLFAEAIVSYVLGASEQALLTNGVSKAS